MPGTHLTGEQKQMPVFTLSYLSYLPRVFLASRRCLVAVADFRGDQRRTRTRERALLWTSSDSEANVLLPEL